jgi:hypothetical protein
MTYGRFVVLYAAGTRFPDCPAKRALVDVIKREFGTTVPAVLGVKLKQMRRKKK